MHRVVQRPGGRALRPDLQVRQAVRAQLPSRATRAGRRGGWGGRQVARLRETAEELMLEGAR
eukprot:6703486-Prymnesium_polylepis.1